MEKIRPMNEMASTTLNSQYDMQRATISNLRR